MPDGASAFPWLQGFNWVGVGGLTALVCVGAWLLVMFTREERG